jgi:hypothetical protein
VSANVSGAVSVLTYALTLTTHLCLLLGLVASNICLAFYLSILSLKQEVFGVPWCSVAYIITTLTTLSYFFGEGFFSAGVRFKLRCGPLLLLLLLRGGLLIIRWSGNQMISSSSSSSSSILVLLLLWCSTIYICSNRVVGSLFLLSPFSFNSCCVVIYYSLSAGVRKTSKISLCFYVHACCHLLAINYLIAYFL